ncbi:hypothetical protein WZ342_2413 [Enterococcus faecalis]|nr:hypothetical protein WZ342_2413 [Enterococcus faecalis]
MNSIILQILSPTFDSSASKSETFFKLDACIIPAITAAIIPETPINSEIK